MKKQTIENIEFTRKQYRTLLKLLYVGAWVSEASTVESDKDIKDVEQLIFSFTKDFDSEDWIEYANEFSQYFPTRQMEDSIHHIMDDYNDSTFWDELSQRLSEREFLKDNKRKLKNMTIEEQVVLRNKYVNKYEKELEKNGLDNLVLKK
ncbi:MAG: hypothetical protein IH948_02760 [Bacteroidetes bacterium]|nr:hypothetical protein [Bacteroidota bacterium]